MLQLVPNFAKTRFRRFPTFHFSTSKFFFKTLHGRLPPEDGSDRPQTLGKRVSGDPRHFIFRRRQTLFATNFVVGKILRQHPEKLFQQSACFGGAVQVYTQLSNAARKFIARHVGFSLLRPLAEG